MWKASLLAIVIALSACAGATPKPSADKNGSVVEPIQSRDRDVLVEAMVSEVKKNAKPTDGPLAVSLPPNDKVLTPAFVSELTKAGYKVETGSGPARHRLRYQIGPMDRGVFMRMSVDDNHTARLFSRDVNRNLRINGPVTVWSVGK